MIVPMMIILVYFSGHGESREGMLFKTPWRESVYLGAVLSQIGEFSFVLGAIAYGSGIISEFAYQLTLSVISLTLLLSPFWIKIGEAIKNDRQRLA